MPPTVTSRDAEKGGLALSLFDRLQAAGVAPLSGTQSINASTHLAASYSHQYAAFFDTLALEALRRRRARDAPS